MKDGKNVCVAIRDVETSENQPWSAKDIKENIKHELKDLIKVGKVKVIIIPDIESINYGRGVGYKIEEIVLTVIRFFFFSFFLGGGCSNNPPPMR